MFGGVFDSLKTYPTPYPDEPDHLIGLITDYNAVDDPDKRQRRLFDLPLCISESRMIVPRRTPNTAAGEYMRVGVFRLRSEDYLLRNVYGHIFDCYV